MFPIHPFPSGGGRWGPQDMTPPQSLSQETSVLVSWVLPNTVSQQGISNNKNGPQSWRLDVRWGAAGFVSQMAVCVCCPSACLGPLSSCKDTSQIGLGSPR